MNLSDILNQNDFFGINQSLPYRPTYYYEVHLSTLDRTILSIVVLILLVFAIAANMATLVVSIRSKKIRPLFRTCLISLAISDLIAAVVTAFDYLTAFFSTFPQLWTLGRTMCHLMPFIKVIANLVSSVTLVGISLDRYLSIRHILKHLWEPGSLCCLLLAVLVWGTSAAIAIPTYTAYRYYPVYLIDTDDDNSSEAITMVSGYMCGAPKSVNARYYMFLFGILFFPMVIAFVWFNSFVALDIFRRLKKKPGLPNVTTKPQPKLPEINIEENEKKRKAKSNGPIFPTDTTYMSKDNSQTSLYEMNRERRQIRMLWIVLLLMIMFLVLKLPEWIFLMISFYSFKTPGSPVLLSFIFGIISMSSAVFNPLLYAFVTQTIQYLMDFYRCVLNFCCIGCIRGAKVISNIKLPTKVEPDDNNSGTDIK